MMYSLLSYVLLDSCLDGMFANLCREFTRPDLGLRINRSFSRINFRSAAELVYCDVESYNKISDKSGTIIGIYPVDLNGGAMIDVMYVGGFASFWLGDIVDIIWE